MRGHPARASTSLRRGRVFWHAPRRARTPYRRAHRPRTQRAPRAWHEKRGRTTPHADRADATTAARGTRRRTTEWPAARRAWLRRLGHERACEGRPPDRSAHAPGTVTRRRRPPPVHFPRAASHRRDPCVPRRPRRYMAAHRVRPHVERDDTALPRLRGDGSKHLRHALPCLASRPAFRLPVCGDCDGDYDS